jgi:hypothetical protein
MLASGESVQLVYCRNGSSVIRRTPKKAPGNPLRGQVLFFGSAATKNIVEGFGIGWVANY